jgi:hypothetical protein
MVDDLRHNGISARELKRRIEAHYTTKGEPVAYVTFHAAHGGLFFVHYKNVTVAERVPSSIIDLLAR